MKRKWDLRYSDLPSRPAFANRRGAAQGRLVLSPRPAVAGIVAAASVRPDGGSLKARSRTRGRDYAAAALHEAGLLTASEVTELAARWRGISSGRRTRDLRICVGFAKPGDTVATWIQGKAARKALYRWSGIPKELIQEWTRERRRRDKTLRKLETATGDQS